MDSLSRLTEAEGKGERDTRPGHCLYLEHRGGQQGILFAPEHVHPSLLKQPVLTDPLFVNTMHGNVCGLHIVELNRL